MVMGMSDGVALEKQWKELAECALAVRERPAAEALTAIGTAMERLIGSRMFTFLRFDFERFDMERLHSSRADRYPAGVRKAMRRGRWYECVAERGTVFIASGEAEMLATFADHAALAELGIRATMCVPVRHEGRTLGTMNLNGDEGRYGEREAELARPFAALAVGPFLTLPRLEP